MAKQIIGHSMLRLRSKWQEVFELVELLFIMTSCTLAHPKKQPAIKAGLLGKTYES